MRFRWSWHPPQPVLAAKLAADLKISPLLVQCLLNRGLSEPAQIESFLEPRLKQLADPFLIPEMSQAVDRLWLARERQEPLVIFGDYDVDGVTSTALLTEVLRRLGWKVSFYLPHRLEEGYGLSQEAVQNCFKKFPASLLLATDCGSTAADTIVWLQSKGVDVVVLDHHQVSTPRPAARALVNPQLTPPGGSSFRELCSVGLAFKFAHALLKRGRAAAQPSMQEFDLRPFLDLVALGTIADLVPLTGENRILVSAGLERLNTTQRPGLVALRNSAQMSGPIGVHEVGFQFAPRLNAAGRLENALAALQLLLAGSLAEAEPMARELETRNRERQTIERRIAEDVVGALKAKFNPETDFAIVEGQLLWHIGVVGIVASRVLREFYRPTIILGGEANEWRGSGRSIEGFDLAAALRQCDDLLIRHGGHAMAAGLSIQPQNLEAFRRRLNDLVRRTIKPEQLQPALAFDAEVCLADLTLERLEELTRLEPMGQGNPRLQFMVSNATLQRPPQRLGNERQHAKLWIADGARTLEAVWWGCHDAPLPSGRFDLAFEPQINEFNGRRSPQLKVLDWRPSP